MTHDDWASPDGLHAALAGLGEVLADMVAAMVWLLMAPVRLAHWLLTGGV